LSGFDSTPTYDLKVDLHSAVVAEWIAGVVPTLDFRKQAQGEDALRLAAFEPQIQAGKNAIYLPEGHKIHLDEECQAFKIAQIVHPGF